MASLGPRAVICYLCGRKYGTSSIKIHEPQCLKKWHIENRLLPKHMRRRPPVRPQGFGEFPKDSQSLGRQVDIMNELSYESSKQQLLPCENCGRTFLPDRLPVHQWSCRPGNSAKPGRSNPTLDNVARGDGGRNHRFNLEPKLREPVKPKTIVCYICGREFGTTSISIHEPQCLKKWKIENNTLPKHMRRQVPCKPDVLPSLTGNDSEDRERRNMLAYESAKQQLVPCPNCNRTFQPDRLSVHIKSCRKRLANIKTMSPNNRFELEEQSNSPPFQPHSPSTPPSKSPKRYGQNKNRKMSSRNDLNNNVNETTRYLFGNNSNFYGNKPNSNQNIKRNSFGNSGLSSKSNSHGNFPNSYENKSNSFENAGRPDSNGSSRSSESTKISGSQRNYKRTVPKKPGGPYEDNGFASQNFAPAGLGTSGLNDPEAFQKSTNVNLVPCVKCGRTFASDRVEKHQSICRNIKQRKLFNTTKQRTEGTDSAAYNRHRKPNSTAAPVGMPKPKSNWRKNHEDFVRAIRDAKKVQEHVKRGGKLSDLPPPPPSENPDYVYCKHCTRRFAPETAARHIPKCATTLSRPAPPKQRAIPLGGTRAGTVVRARSGQQRGMGSRAAVSYR